MERRGLRRSVDNVHIDEKRMEKMPESEVRIRVRYKETDNMGVVHHSNYVNYYEVARTEMMRGRGLSYKEMEARGVMLPVREVQLNYLAPAYYDDLLTVRIRIAERPGVKRGGRPDKYGNGRACIRRCGYSPAVAGAAVVFGTVRFLNRFRQAAVVGPFGGSGIFRTARNPEAVVLPKVRTGRMEGTQ